MQEQTRFTWVTRYLAGLSAGQKWTAAILIVVMIATGVWFGGGVSSGGRDAAWEPLLEQPFTEANVNSISQRLRASSIPFEVREGKVLVPAERKLDALSDLYYASVLTGGGTEAGFDTLIKQMSAWDAPSKTDKLFNRARETMVEQVIARFHGVRKATVLIDPTNERHISGSIQPSAMVDIQTQGQGANPRQLAGAAANVLTGAVANLAQDRVKVTIDGASYSTGGTELAAGDALAHKQQAEQMYVAKVRQLLSYIPDVLVSVSVEVSEKPQAESAAEGSTVIANAVPTVAAASDNAKATSPGSETVRSASVVVPRSYFVGLYKRANRKDLEPDDALLAPIAAAHLGKIRGLVKNSLGLEDDSDVTVELYEDATPAPATPVAAAVASMPTPVATLATRVDRQIVYGLLGVSALLFLTLLLKRTRAATPVPAPVRRTASPISQVLDGTLEDGRDDADELEMESHDLFRRVRDVVEQDPDEAARVLRGWIYQGR